MGTCPTTSARPHSGISPKSRGTLLHFDNLMKGKIWHPRALSDRPLANAMQPASRAVQERLDPSYSAKADWLGAKSWRPYLDG